MCTGCHFVWLSVEAGGEEAPSEVLQHMLMGVVTDVLSDHGFATLGV